MYNFLTIGYDCSPATALRNLNFRKFALPFDWIQSNIHSIQKCFETNFEKFHTNLKINYTKTRLIDDYGFQFPHDYPLIDKDINISEIGEGVFGEDPSKIIIETWNNYYSIVKEKYDRRIERFQTIINDSKPIIILCRYNTKDVMELQNLFLRYYNKDNIYFINSSPELFENEKIKNINTEQNGIWNDKNIWKHHIDKIINKIEKN